MLSLPWPRSPAALCFCVCGGATIPGSREEGSSKLRAGGPGCRIAGMRRGKESLLSYCSLVSSVSSHGGTSSSLTGKQR